MNQHDVIDKISKVLEDIILINNPNRRNSSVLGIDECLDRFKIDQLTDKLLCEEIVEMAYPLWYELRKDKKEQMFSILGGVRSSTISDIGKSVKGYSFPDCYVVKNILVYLLSYKQVIFLSENIKCDKYGLRSIFHNTIKKSLENNKYSLSVIGIFKKGKTKIDDYIEKVYEYLKSKPNCIGYIEVKF